MVFKNPVLRSSALYFLLSIVAFFPCLFLKMAYFDDDLIQAYYFFQKFLRDGIAQGHLHFWNPFLVGGQPFLADANAMAFYPLLYPTLLFQPPVGYGIFCSIHLMLALCGMHYWLRKLDFSERASLVGSLAFGFSGFFWTELVHPLVLADFALIPWFLGALENLIQTPRPSRVFWAGLIFALMFLAGQFQIILCVLCVSPIYALYRAGLSDEWKSLKGGDALLKLFLIVTLFAFASFPMWLMWIPVHEYFSQSARYHAVLDYKTFNAGLSLEFSRLYQFLFPDHPSVYSQSSQLNFQLFQANEGFIGIWMPLFLFWALRKPVRKVTYFSMMAALVFLLIAFGQNFPLHAALCRWVPRFGLMRAPIRYLFVYATFMPVLITAGCEVVFQKLDCGDQHSFLPILAYAVALGGMGLFLFKNPWPQIACLALVTLSIGLWPHGRKAWASNLFILSLAAGLLLVSWDLCSSRLGPLSNFDFEKNRPELSLVKKTIGHSRIFLRDDIPYPVQTLSGPGTIDLPVNAGWPFGLRTVRGYNAMSLVGVERLYRIPASTFARLMALGAFVTGCDLGPVRGFRQMDWGAMRVYFSTNPASYVFCPSHALFFPDDHEAFLALCRKDFNPMDQVVFSNPLPEGENTRRTDMRYEWVKNDPDEESFDIQMGKPNWAVFSEVNYPGWRAWVDEKESAIVTADTVLRAVYIPAGKHRVCFRFKPAWIPWLGSGGVAWLAGVILFIIYRRKLDLRFSLW